MHVTKPFDLIFSLNIQVMRLGMFEVHCDDLIRSLAKRAESLCQKLLGKMSEDHKEANKK
jgi:dynein heavy chain